MKALKDVLMEERQSLYGSICKAAEFKPEESAIVFVKKNGGALNVSWRELRSYVDRLSARLNALGIGEGSRVVVAMPNSLGAVSAMLAVWHLGGCAFLLSSELPENERRLLLGQITPALVISAWKNCGCETLNLTETELAALPDAEPLPDVIGVPAKACATGGSTGTPKIIIEDAPLVYGREDFISWNAITGQDFGYRQLICGSLHHSLFCNSFIMGLAMGNSAVITRRFDEAQVLSCIERYGINCMVLVPTMMSRVIRSPRCKETDLSSIKTMHHAGALCPRWLKQDWIELIGAEKVHEFYSMTEKIGTTAIRGDEWLLHPESAGRAYGCSVEILDDEQNPVPNGTIGSVYFHPSAARNTHYLLGEQRLVRHGDAVSVGDLGYMDDEGYLYLVDRRSDMIISGGENIYPAEVENALRAYPQVEDIVVIGLPDSKWGRRVHALIELNCPRGDFDIYEFTSFGFKQLSNYKLPKTIELLDRIPRDNAGKVNKRALVEDRLNAGEDGGEFNYIKLVNGHQLIAWRAKKAKQ